MCSAKKLVDLLTSKFGANFLSYRFQTLRATKALKKPCSMHSNTAGYSKQTCITQNFVLLQIRIIAGLLHYRPKNYNQPVDVFDIVKITIEEHKAKL